MAFWNAPIPQEDPVYLACCAAMDMVVGAKALGDELQERYERLSKQAEADRARTKDAYSRLYSLIYATGYIPGEEELEAAGMSRAAAEALRSEYLRKTGRG